jgi:ubiquinone/menaquinone biosynthesis C-methylase UbiE
MAKRWAGGRLLNAGCGHGADFLPFKGSFELHGCDFSLQMLLQAQRYSMKYDFPVKLMQADLSALPYRGGAFKWAISVAAYHHIQGGERALRAFRELRRVLEPGGEIFITVWNRFQPRFWWGGRDVLIPWKTKEHTYMRYYHLYDYKSLSSMVERAGFRVLKTMPESSYRFPIKYFSRNVCLLARAP